MSNPRERAAEDAYEAENDEYAGDEVKSDRSYAGGDQRKTGGPQVVADEDADLGADAVPGSETNSDAQLRRDEKEAIDTSNILPGAEKGIQTRGVRKNYKEPGDEEGLPGRGDTGSSSLRTGTI